MKIVVDKNLCISAGDCTQIAPNTFELDADGKSNVKAGPLDSKEKILEAAKSCPVAAIFIYDDDGKLLWPQTGEPSEEAKKSERTV